MWKKIKIDFQKIFFQIFFFENLWILEWSRTNSGEKEWHPRMWKKNSKQKYQNFFFNFFFQNFFFNFFFKTSESWYGREPILVKKNDTLECEKKIKKKFWILFSIFFSKPLNFGMVANQSILVKKNDTLGCEKKFKKKFQFFFLNFFFKTPEFWYGREPILVKKMTL